jgi:hypothetical protein
MYHTPKGQRKLRRAYVCEASDDKAHNPQTIANAQRLRLNTRYKQTQRIKLWHAEMQHIKIVC